VDQVFKNINVTLAAVGGTHSRIVKMNHFIIELSNLSILRELRDRYLNLQNPPARIAAGVTSLANTIFFLEIKAVAMPSENT
jgi:enamine deaminase RidA (YjgF/YER057c/UK114 family)